MSNSLYTAYGAVPGDMVVEVTASSYYAAVASFKERYPKVCNFQVIRYDYWGTVGIYKDSVCDWHAHPLTCSKCHFQADESDFGVTPNAGERVCPHCQSMEVYEEEVCGGCNERLSEDSIGGGRCTNCGTMIFPITRKAEGWE
jgi:predicted RNA-binding Zn-ribbon protein involved in translation (DUF1610 family)